MTAPKQIRRQVAPLEILPRGWRRDSVAQVAASGTKGFVAFDTEYLADIGPRSFVFGWGTSPEAARAMAYEAGHRDDANVQVMPSSLALYRALEGWLNDDEVECVDSDGIAFSIDEEPKPPAFVAERWAFKVIALNDRRGLASAEQSTLTPLLQKIVRAYLLGYEATGIDTEGVLGWTEIATRRGGLTIAGGTLSPLATDQVELAREIAENLQMPDAIDRHLKLTATFAA